MACRIKNNKAFAKNGNESILFNSLVESTGNVVLAEEVYRYMYTKEFKDDFGMDFENNPKSLEETFLFTDKNGEPKLINGFGNFLIPRTDGTFITVTDKKGKPVTIPVSQTSMGVDYVYEKAAVDTMISFVNDIRNRDPKFFKGNTKFFGSKTKGKDKGILAERIAAEAFEGLPLNEYGVPTRKSRELAVDILEKVESGELSNADAVNAALPEGASLKKVAPLFHNIYNNWQDEFDSETGNRIKKGWRTSVIEGFEDYGLRLREDTKEILDIDDTPIRIHDRSRLEESLKDKLSTTVKAFLTDIRSEQKNVIGYKTAIPLDQIYSEISEAAVNQTNFNGMIVQLNTMAKYKPELTAVINKLERLSTKDQAAFFSNFASSYKKFLQFRTKEILREDGKSIQVEMFPSDRNSISVRSVSTWKGQRVEADMPNPKALYKPNENGQLEVIDSKRKKANAAFEKIKNINLKPVGAILEDADVENLSELLANLGIYYGNTQEESTANLKRYFTIGNGDGITGMALYKQEVFRKKKGVDRLIKALNEGKDIYSSKFTLDVIQEWGKLSPYFIKNPAESFLSGGGKTYYPINSPTRLDELVVQIQNNNRNLFDTLITTPLFSPGTNIKHQSLLLTALANTEARDRIQLEILDSSKGINDFGIGDDYENQNEKVSLITRLNAYANNGSDYFKLAVPTQADRKRLDFITIPKFYYYNKALGTDVRTTREAIKGIIIQDLSVMKQARQDIDNADGDISKLIEGYHYAKGTDPFAAETGSAFTMPQIAGLNYTQDLDGVNDLIDGVSAVTTTDTGAAETQKIDEILERLVDDVENKLESYETRLRSEMQRLGVNQATDLHSSVRTNKNLVKDFVFNDFLGRIEVNKLLRAGSSYAKNPADFYKRMGLVNTPGKKLFIKGTGTDSNSTYGMMPTYKAASIQELDFQDRAVANDVADTMLRNLITAGVSRENAIRISEQYRSVVKTDGQGFISVDMYRGIQQGMGEWTTADEQAYNNEKKGLGYVDDAGNPRPIYPIKPYHEEITVIDGKPVLVMDKNSYVTLTKDFTSEYPVLEKLRSQMEAQGIQVVNEVNANKGARKDVRNPYTDNLDNMTTITLDSNNLRLPQIMPKGVKDKITFSRQIRKNIIANWMLEDSLNVEFQDLVAQNIAEDTRNLQNELGITQLRNAKRPEQRKAAKLDHLKKLRERLISQIREKGLPDSYLGALDIVPNGPYDYRFAIPLAFPNYQAKFEQIYFSLFNNGIFTQKQKGKELIQIAEVGGHIESSELKMYDGTEPAQIMMRASDLGFPPDTNIEDVKGDPRLTMIGYRIPNQGKNSMLPMKVIRFLPESHVKGIVVPGGVTKQMGSDFDIDKMIAIQKEIGDSARAQRDQRIFDIMYDSLTAKEHLSEVLDPLEGDRLKSKAGENVTVDYNDPFSEIDMEMRNKAGIRLRGSWANILAGHNMSQRGNLRIDMNHAPIIEGVRFDQLGKVFEYDLDNNQDSELYNTASISAYLTAAVDAANDPIQIDINDNEFTVPVAGLMLSTGVPVEQVIDFLTQPAIVKAIEVARNRGYNPGQLFKAISEVRAEYKGIAEDQVVSMSLEELSTKDEANQVKMLNNFGLIHRAARSAAKAFKVITPDNLSNVNEMASLRAWLDTEAEYTSDQDIQLIRGAEEFITELQEGVNNVSPLQVAYRGIFDTMLESAEDAGFINNRLGFNVFKRILKQQLGVTSFNKDTHKLIDKALFLKLMAHPDSPLADYMSKERFNKLYTDPNNNIALRLARLQESGILKGNLFFENLRASDTNNEKGMPVFTIELDTTFDAGVIEKNNMTEGFRQILANPETREFGEDLIANQLMTNGFQQRSGSYMDMIPAEVFTTSTLDGSKESPAMFFSRIQTSTYDPLVFNDFVHDFIRNFGTARPGGSAILPQVRSAQLKPDSNGVVRLPKNGAPSVYKGKERGWAAYFISYPEGKPQIYVRVGEGAYRQLQQKGIKGKVNEVGNTSNTSAINKEGETGLPSLNPIEKRLITKIETNIEDVPTIQKLCRI